MAEMIDFNTVKERGFEKYKPPITLFICMASIALFIGINLEEGVATHEVFKKWGAPSALYIFNGSYWGLLTSSFLHTELWHLGFNLYWIWIFGKKVEYETNPFFFIFLILSASLVSSAAQLSFSDATGIGLSGIGYALFGFIVLSARTKEEYRHHIDKRTENLFALWLPLCIVLTQLDILNVGNAAHIGGLLWGLAVAYFSRFHWSLAWTAKLALLALVGSMIFWSPFSTAYLSHKAYELHDAQKIEEAIAVYEEILNRDEDNEFAKSNLKNLELHQLSLDARRLHQLGNYKEARQAYEEIINRDPDNQWAKEQLSRLPKD
ncbi:MAG TPA: hypothetical protein DIW47_11415 [Bacteroidetes bacterium]|nr:hypothetical protein [Bacteroidota bacterium]